jgi:predicted RNase H-like HicB family nuclease
MTPSRVKCGYPHTVNETISRDVKLRALVRQDTKERWVAVCPSIDVASQGIDSADAKRCLDEAVQLWFESCIERGMLERALQESHFRPLHADEIAPQDVRGNAFVVRVTMPTQRATV